MRSTDFRRNSFKSAQRDNSRQGKICRSSGSYFLIPLHFFARVRLLSCQPEAEINPAKKAHEDVSPFTTVHFSFAPLADKHQGLPEQPETALLHGGGTHALAINQVGTGQTRAENLRRIRQNSPGHTHTLYTQSRPLPPSVPPLISAAPPTDRVLPDDNPSRHATERPQTARFEQAVQLVGKNNGCMIVVEKHRNTTHAAPPGQRKKQLSRITLLLFLIKTRSYPLSRKY